MPFLLAIFNFPPNAYFHHLPPLSASQVHTQFRECLMPVDCFSVCTWCVLNEAKRVLLCCPFVDCPLRLYSCWRKHHELLMAMLATSVTSTAIMYEIFFLVVCQNVMPATSHRRWLETDQCFEGDDKMKNFASVFGARNYWFFFKSEIDGRVFFMLLLWWCMLNLVWKYIWKNVLKDKNLEIIGIF